MSHSGWGSWDHGLYLLVSAWVGGSLIIALGPGILLGFKGMQAGLLLCGLELKLTRDQDVIFSLTDTLILWSTDLRFCSQVLFDD